MNPHPERGPENGNVIFYIFLAIALFGALSFAVSQSGRESGAAAASEQDRLRATEIIDYTDTVAKAVATIRLRGTSLQALRFSDPALSAADYGAPTPDNGTNEVFNVDGGGVNYRKPNPDAITTATEDYKFIAGNEIQNVGLSCAAPNCTELLMVLPHIKPSICVVINTLDAIPGQPPVVEQFDLNHPFQGTMSYAQTLGADVNSAALAGHMDGCFKNAADNAYYFYRVLWQQ